LRGPTGQPAESSGDAIAAFAGLIVFAYYHVIGLVLWLKVEPFRDMFPQGLPTMIVSWKRSSRARS
jgi:hypothetical protein